MKSNQCRMKESEFENTDTYWSYFSKLSSSSSASLSSLRSFITTTCKAGPTETLPSPRVAPTVSSNHGHWSCMTWTHLSMQCIRYSSKNHICLDAIRLTNTLSLYLSPLCRLWSKTEYEANLNNLPQEQRSPVFAKPTTFDCSSSWSNDQKGIKMLNEKLAEPWLKHQQQSICI